MARTAFVLGVAVALSALQASRAANAVEYSGPFCKTGITNFHGSACCPAHCETCGACYCTFRGDAVQGSADYCCPNNIHRENVWCATPTDTGCVLRDQPKKVSSAKTGCPHFEYPPRAAPAEGEPVVTVDDYIEEAGVECSVTTIEDTTVLVVKPNVVGRYSYLGFSIYMATEYVEEALLQPPHVRPAHDLHHNLDWEYLAEFAVPNVVVHPVVARMNDVFETDINAERASQAIPAKPITFYNTSEEGRVTGVRPSDWVTHGHVVNAAENILSAPGTGSFAIVITAKDITGSRVDSTRSANYCIVDIAPEDAPDLEAYERPALIIPEPFDIEYELSPWDADGKVPCAYCDDTEKKTAADH